MKHKERIRVRSFCLQVEELIKKVEVCKVQETVRFVGGLNHSMRKVLNEAHEIRTTLAAEPEEREGGRGR